MNRPLSTRCSTEPPSWFRRALRATVRRILPTHPSVGFPWIFLPDGSVTFRESGFVAASSPAMLLARHNWETLYIRRTLANITVSRSLEVGCGYGRLTPTLTDHSRNHIGVDINSTALSMASSAYPNSCFAGATARELPIRDHVLDLVCTWTALQHIPPDLISNVCSEIVRVLSPCGLLLICEETRHSRRVRRPHTWHRPIDEYARLLAPLKLQFNSYIHELDRIPGGESPGQVMLWTTRS